MEEKYYLMCLLQTTNVLGRKQKQYYIYATTDLTGSKSYSDVYFMDLLAFCPNYSSIYEVGDSDSQVSGRFEGYGEMQITQKVPNRLLGQRGDS